MCIYLFDQIGLPQFHKIKLLKLQESDEQCYVVLTVKASYVARKSSSGMLMKLFSKKCCLILNNEACFLESEGPREDSESLSQVS